MPVYKRQLKGGLKFRFKGYNPKATPSPYYSSPSIYDTKEDAEKAEKVFLASLKQDTLERLMRDRIDYLKAYNASKDYLIDTQAFFKIAKEFWGPDRSVTEITKRDAFELIQKETLKRQQEGQTNHPVNHMIRIMRAFFNFVSDVKEIPVLNPFKKVKLLPISDDKKYIPSEFEMLIARKNLNPQQRKLFDFVKMTGCRVGEALRLRRKDINGDSLTLWTRKAKNSDLTPRTIPRPPCLKDSDLPDDPEERVFKTWTSYPRFLEEAVKTSQMALPENQKKKWNWHNLRHAACSKWANDNMSLIEIQSRLGHVNIEVTQQYMQLLGFSKIKYSSDQDEMYKVYERLDREEEAMKDAIEEDFEEP